MEQVLLLLVHLNAAPMAARNAMASLARWDEAKEVARHATGSDGKRRPPAMPCLHHDVCVSNISKSDGLLRLKRQAVEVLDRHARRRLDHKLRSNNPILATLRYHRRPQSLALNVARFTTTLGRAPAIGRWAAAPVAQES